VIVSILKRVGFYSLSEQVPLLLLARHAYPFFVGKSGSVIPLMSNYFKIIAAPGWHLYQYQVDFSDVDLPKVVRKGMMNDHKELFSCHLFDGMQLYSPTKLPNEVSRVQLYGNIGRIKGLPHVGGFAKEDRE